MKSMKVINSGKNILVENCTSISINVFVKSVKDIIKEELLIKKSTLFGQEIDLVKSKIGINGFRYWFKCSFCNDKVGKIFVHPISKIVGCRKCLGLEYRSRRYKGMLESNKLN
jgi:hypothetical protein